VPGAGELADWFAAGAAELVATLGSVDLDQECWTFSSSASTARFWVRRQAHETAVHRWDAETAAGHPDLVDARLAADGVDEVAGFFYPREVELGRRAALGTAVTLRPTDAGEPVVLGEGEPVAEAAGPAELLLLALWHRRSADALLDGGSLTASGDVGAARRVLGERLTP
jgi:uncharacterized protein (TIGR03083 family)